MLLLICFLHCSFAAVQKQLLVTGKNNISYNILGYSPYKNYALKVEGLLSDKIRDTYNFALQFSDTSPSVLLSRTTREELALLQLLHSFDLQNNSFTDFLIHISNIWPINPAQAFKNFADGNFVFPPERLYQIIKFVAKEKPALPNAISEQIFNLNIKYNVFEEAAKSGDEEVLKWLLIHGTWKDKTVDSKIIETAWMNGKIKVIELLMKYSIITNQNLHRNIVNERYRNNETLLHVASRGGYDNTVILLVSSLGANINSKDIAGKSPLYRAVENSKHKVVEILISKGADTVTEPLLTLAVGIGHNETVKTLVDLNVPFHIKDENGETPLFLAVKNNDVKSLEILTNNSGPNKAALNSTNELGDTLMHVAASRGFLNSVRALVKFGVTVHSKNNYGETPLFKAIEAENTDLIQFLIQSGSDINSRTSTGDTIIHLAASLGNTDIAQFLLTQKLDFPVDAANNNGETPLYKAALVGKCEMLKFLLKNGADIARKNDGFTMLHLAAAEGNERAVVCLIDSGLDVDTTGLWNITPLNLAVTQGHLRIVRKLLERNANPNAKTKNLWTPLHRSVLNGNLDIIRLLHKYKADISALNDKGLNPLLLAVENQKVLAAELIRSLFK